MHAHLTFQGVQSLACIYHFSLTMGYNQDDGTPLILVHHFSISRTYPVKRQSSEQDILLQNILIETRITPFQLLAQPFQEVFLLQTCYHCACLTEFCVGTLASFIQVGTSVDEITLFLVLLCFYDKTCFEVPLIFFKLGLVCYMFI